jgi:hypothetical protein
MEWLERFSPMKVHWAQKWLSVPYGNGTITLQGIVPGSLDCNMVELVQISSDQQPESTDPLLDSIQSLLQQFQQVFDAPSEIPPSRACDHKIPLIVGATPVHSRPYRYGPTLKDEIERQVSEMLQAGLIQPS